MKSLSIVNESLTLYNTFVRRNEVIKSINNVTGNAINIHLPNEISGASGNIIFSVFTKTKFGGVPTSVASPPIVQEYATPSSKVRVKLCVVSLPNWFSIRVIIANAIGSIIIIVAVLEIHIDKKP